MFDLPFPLQNVPAADADAALHMLLRNRNGTIPVLLGDSDIFATEWAEFVDTFDAPDMILRDALQVDINAWFAVHNAQFTQAEAQMSRSFKVFNRLCKVFSVSFDLLRAPSRVVRWALTGHRPKFWSRSPFDYDAALDDAVDHQSIQMLRTQLAELEVIGESNREDLQDIRDIIHDMEAGLDAPFPDPVAYVTPRNGEAVAAALVDAKEPWETAAWLQHGTYAQCAPKPILVAFCKWMWDSHGARIITASTDHIGFQLARPIKTKESAVEVMSRFFVLGATEVNAESRGSNGSSLINADRLWVWWD